MKKAILVLCALAVSVAAFGDLAKYKDWAKSPDAYFLTAPEREEWARLKSDEEAEKFIELYWVKRGGEPFKQEIARRIAAADQQFKLRRYERGSLSTRGRLIVVLGPPNKQMRERMEETANNSRGSGDTRGDITTGASSQQFTWTYEAKHFPSDWNIGELQIKIMVDPVRGTDELLVGTLVEKAIAKVAERSIVNPSGKPAAVAARPGGGPAAAAPAAPAPLALPAAVRTTLEAAAGGKKIPEGSFWGGSFRTLGGDSFYAFGLAVAADQAGAGAKLGGVVTSDTGEEKASFWEDATLMESKTGGLVAKLVVKSVALPPGSYRASFGLFSADGSAALVSAAPEFKLEPRSDSFEVSPLVITNALTPLGKRVPPTEPFIFGTPEKPIQIVPKINRHFTNQDALWYFYTVGNPARPAETAPAAAPGATPAPPPGSTAAAPAAEAPRPRVMTTISVLRSGKPAFQPATAPAELLLFGQGVYGEGKEIPLEKFDPGYYTFVVNVRDLNAPRDSVSFKGFERRSDFVVLKPDGSMPDKPAPPTPVPAPRAPGKKG